MEGQTLGLFYQIVYGIALPYLKDLILPFKPPQHGYNLRNVCNFNFVIIQSMTFTYYDSFLPSSVQLWNNLLWKQSVMSGFFFKNVLKHFVELAKKNDKIYKYENRKDNVTHCQFKNRSSNLQFSTNKDCGRICDDNVYFLFT